MRFLKSDVFTKIKEWIKIDGLLHFETAALITVILWMFFPWWISAIITILIGAGKEAYDIKYGTPSWHDFICDVVGVIFILTLFFSFGLMV